MKGLQQHATLHLTVQPRASRNQIVGWDGETLRIKLTAPPVDGAANAACLKFLADALDLPVSRLAVLRGERSRVKAIAIEGLSLDELSRKIQSIVSRV